MKKIIILHRDDLYGLTRREPIANIVYESFPDPLLKFLKADFIAFEDDRTGLLKILKNNYGTCITISHEHFLMAIDRITKISATEASFPKDMQDKMIPPDEKVWKILNEIPSDPIMNPHIGFDPAAVGCDVSAFIGNNGISTYFDRTENNKAFEEQVSNMAQYYGENLVVDFSYQIDQKVKEAVDIFRGQGYYLARDKFPECLTEAILYFNRGFDNVFKVMFQHTEIYFTSTLQVSYPELYTEIKKECGFWCKDTPLYKDLLTFGGDHEEFMINTILKGIFRFRNYGRDKSGDVTAILEEFKEQRNNDLKKS